jgi:hypothetical protein
MVFDRGVAGDGFDVRRFMKSRRRSMVSCWAASISCQSRVRRWNAVSWLCRSRWREARMWWVLVVVMVREGGEWIEESWRHSQIRDQKPWR